MRLTPAQIGMHGLLGQWLPMGMPRDQSLANRIRDGHVFLVRIAKIDLGYDPQAWHEYLRATNAGGYRWSNKHLGFPRLITNALANPEWQEAVTLLRVAQDTESDRLAAARTPLAQHAPDENAGGLVSKAPGATLLTSGLGSKCYGIVPIDGRESTAVFLGGKTVSKRVVGAAIGEIVALTGNNYQQDGYVPVTVESSGYLPGGTTNFNVACAYQASTGYTFYAWIDGRQNNQANTVICVIARDGRVVSQDVQFYPSASTNPASTSVSLGLTAIGGRVVLWTGASGTNQIQTYEVVLSSDLKLTYGSSIGLYVPVALPTFGNIALAYDPDDDTTVYLACRHDVNANSVQVMRLNMTGAWPTIAAQQTHAIGAAWTYLSLAYMAGDCVLLAVSRAAGCNFTS